MVVQAQQKEDIWVQYHKSRNIELRNQLVLTYVHLVKIIVLRLIPSYGGILDVDDLMSCGIIGLIDAIEKFDAGKGAKFETYASLRIKGTIIDQLRKQDWVPRSLRSKVKDIKECYEQLELEKGREATDEEVAGKLNMEVEEVRKALLQSHTFQMISMDDQIMDAVRWDSDLPKADSNPEHEYVNKELHETIARHINHLPEREKMVMALYYYEELTFKEIGKVLGVTESRICQIHSKALMKLRSRLEKAI